MNTLLTRRLTILCLTFILALAPAMSRLLPPHAVAAQTPAPSSVVAWGLPDSDPDLTPPADLGRVKAIAISPNHALAVKSDGRVVAWGDNRAGVLNVPANLVGVKAIATFFEHNLALKSDGTVIAWGRNDFGQTDVPAGLNNVIAIAAGSQHSLALKADGTVVTWPSFNAPLPLPPAGLNRVTAIAAGNAHSLALKDDGTVVAWGLNRSGQLNVPAGLNNVVAIAAGSDHSLALKDDGTVVAWGNNDQGQTNVPADLRNITAISGGLVHSLALKADGTVVAWGLPDVTRLPAGLRNVTAIAAGFPQSLALVTEPQAIAPSCATLCFRAPQYYLNRLDQLPNGTIFISGGGKIGSVSTNNRAQMRLALDGGNSPQDRFNHQFAALQLTLLSTPGPDDEARRSRLSCFNLDFEPVSFSFGLPLNPRSSLGDLLSVANFATGRGNASDLEALAGILGLLNGNDPLGRCGTGGKLAFSPAVRTALNEAVASTLAQFQIPGAVVGVWVPGAGSLVMARGVADVATGELMQTDRHFRIGSNTKTFTVTALLQLADGSNPRLRLDDPVSKYLSFVPNGNQITLRMLANMTSGLASYTQSEPFVQALLSNTQRVWTPRELVDIGLALPAHFAPGRGWHYSNTNTVLLGLVIEQVTGKPIHQVFAEQIFQPLGLRQTVWPLDGALPAPYAHGITKQTLDGQQADATNWNPSWGHAAGQLISNLEDMRTWARALGTGELLSAQMQAERLKLVTIPPQTATESYGAGIGYDNGWLGHTGALMGYTSSVYYLPELDATIVVLTNSDIDAGGEAPSVALFKALARIVTPNHVPKRG